MVSVIDPMITNSNAAGPINGSADLEPNPSKGRESTMAERSPHLNGNHLSRHTKGHEAIHPMHRGGGFNDYGGHHGQDSFGGHSAESEGAVGHASPGEAPPAMAATEDRAEPAAAVE
jgi:hypothetical protein